MQGRGSAEEPLSAVPEGALEVRAERGASRTVHAFALEVQGGLPFSPALVEVQVDGRPVRTTLLLDGEGRARKVVRGARLDEGSRVLARALSATGLGALASAAAPPPLPPLPPLSATWSGDFVITEFMKDPVFVPDTAGEWIEVHNRSLLPLDIEGWILRDAGTNHHVINRGGAGLVIPPGGYMLLGNNDNLQTNGGVHVAYRYSNFVLGNGADAIMILDPGGSLVDAVFYDDGILWPDTPGRSASLAQPWTHSLSNDDPWNWCDGSSAMGWGADLGTPGRPNGLCY